MQLPQVWNDKQGLMEQIFSSVCRILFIRVVNQIVINKEHILCF